MIFNPDHEIPNLSGKVIIVTGGNSGLGKECVHQIAKHNPQRIFLGARNASKAQAAIDEVEAAVPAIKGRITFLELDLASIESVKKAADTFRAQSDRLDLLMNNAGIVAAPPGLSVDGYEPRFATNYIGPILFTKLLLSTLQATVEIAQSEPDVRVVDLNTAAFSETPPSGLLLSDVHTEMSNIHYMKLYGHSKLAYYYHTKLMAQKYPSIKFVAVHPGWVYTSIFEPHFKGRPYIGAAVGFLLGMFLTDVHQGAKGQLWASFGPKEKVRAGGFYKPSGQEFEHPLLENEELAQELWDWTEAEFVAKGIPPSQFALYPQLGLLKHL